MSSDSDPALGNMKQYKPSTDKLPFQSDKEYHVFLSFRGPDVRKTLVDHLYQALSTAGLNVFLDSDKLERGEIIDSILETAIKSSAIRIPIFSKGYADSVWCLREAALISSTPGLIIPLFYHVEPTHVRYPESDKSPYKQSFLEHRGHKDRYTREAIDDWKEALKQICSHSGWSMHITEGYEARLVKMVVNDLIKTLDKVPLHVAKYPVGIDKVKDVLVQELDLNSVDGVVKVGIWGIGGIGKTTVAKAVYNQVYGHFSSASFIFNVRATAEVSGLTKLQKKILRDLCKYNGEVDSVDQGKSLFKDRLGGNSVLLVLDDVDTVVQLDALVGGWLTAGSKVIITSRNKHIFNVAGISSERIHEMSGLDIDDATKLFSWHAFLQPLPSSNCEELSKGIVEACKGHPLSLEVIGAFLYDKQYDKGCWTEALHNITLIPDTQQSVHNTLKISYSGLSDEEKEIFVDIACFFNGEDKTLPIVFWNSLYKTVDTALSNLLMKLLIKIDSEGVFHMHDHLRDMGQTIAENESKRTRLCGAAHLSTLYDNINLSRLRLNGGNPQRLEVLNMPGLRYLHLQNLCIEGMTEDILTMLPKSLIWLRLEDCPFAIGMNRAKKKTRFSRFMESFWQSKIMQLKGCTDLDSIFISSLFSSPNNLSQLQHLDLRWCKNLINLPDSVGNLSQLQHLDLRWCKSLISLPDSIGNLSQLQHLDLGWCDRISNLPNTIGNLSKLQHLNMFECRSLKNLPSTISSLSQLQQLNLERCVSLSDLHGTIGNLSELQHLNLESCVNLNNLPSTIGNLSQLQNLNLRWCDRLRNLPNEIGNLVELKNLYLGKCRSLENLPNSIGNLSQLQHLDLEGCIKLTDLPSTIGNMSGLQHLNLKWSESLKNLPDTIANLPQLRHLELRGCKNLHILPPRILSRPELHF